MGLIDHDPWLAPYEDAIRARYRRYMDARAKIDAAEGSLLEFARGHERLGFSRAEHGGRAGVWYREWAPGAQALSLVGDFNGWNRDAHPMTADAYGVWSIFVAGDAIAHAARVKVYVRSDAGGEDRIPAYIRRVEFDRQGQNATGIVWMPPAYQWKHARPSWLAQGGSPRIYEAHVGMAVEEGRVGTFAEFERDVLVRVARAGYNCIQFMAVQEHPYYASFGYHVSNFFAVSSRFGTPEEFKSLVDAAHALGIAVVIDLVHSHSVKNTVEGLNGFDGTDHQYFHAGPKGEHPAWGSLLFDYGKWEVQRFLLSNVRYWLEEYNIDGFRFDGVTSMMYEHHGLGQGFSSYDDYLRHGIDEDAVMYLQMACDLARMVCPGALNIAEDVSGMVGLCRPTAEGGIGFDYRLAMGLPDYWIRLLRAVRDEDWRMDEIFSTLCNRRHMERHIAYCESHDQALVGDKTIAFWLMDQEMYWNMSRDSQSLVVERGVALHKMIRLVTFALGGEGWLNFMGNEFGHPEWIDFPREGNQWSFHYCRRQWSLSERADLRYAGLGAFDRAMVGLDASRPLLASPQARLLHVHEEHKLLAFERGGLLFVFNWHPTRSASDLRIAAPIGDEPGGWRMVLNSDAREFDGHDLVATGERAPVRRDGEGAHVMLYVPARSVQVYAYEQGV
jgi:1,4-alpha-glucan branching enzyme